MRLTTRVMPLLTYSLLFGLTLVVFLSSAGEIYERYALPIPIPHTPLWQSLLEGAAIALVGPVEYVILQPLLWLCFRRSQVTMDGDTIVCRQAWKTIRSHWPQIVLLEEDDEYIFIGGRAKRGMVFSLVLPKRSFPTKEAERAFFEEATLHWEGANANLPIGTNSWPPLPQPTPREKSAP